MNFLIKLATTVVNTVFWYFVFRNRRDDETTTLNLKP